MFPLTLLFCFYFVQFSSAFHSSTNGLFGFVLGYQKLCFCRCGVVQRQFSDSNIRNGRLLGGEATTPNQFPWLAIINTGPQTIGGSLISDRHVITAASPLHGVPSGRISITFGAHDRCGTDGDATLSSSVESVIVHPSYSPANGNNDIALLRTRHVISFSQYVSPICIPSYASQESEQIAWTAAWMQNSSNSNCIPHVTTLPMLPTKACLNFSGNSTLKSSDKGCLGPLGAKSLLCKTDVGAPVMTRRVFGAAFKLVGIVSFSSCESQAAPLFTRVTDHTNWIQEHIRNDCQCF